MAIRYYLVPKIGDGNSISTAFRPKYIESMGLRWSAMDYGIEPIFLVSAEVNPQQHNDIISNPDVLSIPASFDSQIDPAILTAVKNKLEGIRVPGSWLSETNTWRDALRVLVRVFRLNQKFLGLNAGTLFSGGVTLDTKLNQLTAQQRQKMLQTAQALGVDTTGIVASMTVREALKTIADLIPPGSFNGESF